MGQPDCWLCIWKWQTLLFLSKARINILDDDTECVNSKWVNQIVDSVFGNDKLCCFCPRPESTFWTMTQNASTQNLKFPILLFHINKVGARINQMGHHFNKMGARINKMGHSESTKCGAPTICLQMSAAYIQHFILNTVYFYQKFVIYMFVFDLWNVSLIYMFLLDIYCQ